MGVEQSDSFITHLNQLKDMEKAKNIGLDNYSKELNEKISTLQILLTKYDDGRRKSFYCVAVNLLELHDIKAVMEKLELTICPEQSIKEKALIAVEMFQSTADQQGISLKLRKKVKK